MENDLWELAVNHCCSLGECPVWDTENQRILWVDILEGEIHQWETLKNKHSVFNVDQLIGALVLTTTDELIVALKDGFACVDREGGPVRWLATPENHSSGNRFNDGKCDPAGRFWAGSMHMQGEKNRGNVYALEPDFSVDLKIKNASTPNGMAWSPDYSMFYYIDTAEANVMCYGYEMSTGKISNPRVVITVPSAMGRPDGMTIDTEGMLWIALWDGWQVSRWDPVTGKLLKTVHLPVAQVTSCTFGGKNLEDLYVTTAKTGLTSQASQQQPLAGALFVIRNCGYKGKAPERFRSQLT